MHRRLAVLALLAALPAQAAQHDQTDCRAVVEIFPGTTLDRLADTWFGDVEYRHAILSATNARAGQGFGFIGNPSVLPVGGSLCIPQITEAEVEKNRFMTYEDAVGDMSLPYPSEVSDSLDPITPGGPATVVSWVRRDQAEGRPGDPGWIDKIGKTETVTGNTWVTLAPHLQEFCAQHVQQRGPNPAALTLRLEQRLGLAPQSAKTHFVEFEVADPLNRAQIFRPCVDPDVTTTTCAFGAFPNCARLKIDAGTPQERDATPDEKAACADHYAFFTDQYYHSYGVSLPTEFPWTSLGYTFDWAHAPIGASEDPAFVQYGESEYVLPPGARITVKSVTPTADYCTPK